MASSYANFLTTKIASLAIFTFFALCGSGVYGQLTGGIGGTVLQVGVVGGVAVDADSLLSRGSQRISDESMARINASLRGADNDINRKTKLRMVSLKALNGQIVSSLESGTPLPVDVQFMAGLQRIEFLIVDKENNDLILAGPGEGLTSDVMGNIVGSVSGTPAIHLEDFLIAMRSADNARTGRGISVSMDPTAQGIKNYRAFSSKFGFRPELVNQLQDAMGEHNITLTGVPKDSRYSQVLVAADHRMKQLAMGVEQSHAKNFPSVLDMAKKANARGMNGAPRMWMECDYQPVSTDEDGTIWELKGQGVKALTENAMFDKDGKSQVAKKQNKFAEKWASNLTKRFDDVSKAEPVFRDLRNLMDLSVISAIISRNQIISKMGIELDAITDSVVQLPSRPVPATVPTECSFVNIGSGYLVTVSGGVQVDSWAIAKNTEIDNDLKETAIVALASNVKQNWWWNAE